MKRLLIAAGASLMLAACNNQESGGSSTREMSAMDSLRKEIDDIHIVGMSKMGQLNKLQQRVEHYIDSLDQLPSKAKNAAASLKSKADSLLQDLNYADFAMNKWMHEYYNPAIKDTLANQPEKLLEYLRNEREKAQKITDAIVQGIEREL